MGFIVGTEREGRVETMVKVKEPIKRVAVALGKQYNLMKIDQDWCLYRDLGNGYDIGINLHGTKSITMQAIVYVWQVRGELKVIQTIRGIKEIEDLQRILRGVVNKTNRLANMKNKVYQSDLVQAI